MPARRDPLRELEQLVRRPEAGATNIAAHLLEHHDELRVFLPAGWTRANLAGNPDEALAPALERRLRHHADAQLGLREEGNQDRARSAAMQLATTAGRTDRTVTLDVALLLGNLLVDRTVSHVSFELGDDARVPILRTKLLAVRKALGHRHDLTAAVDHQGLTFRWNGSRACLRLWPQPCTTCATVLIVDMGAAHGADAPHGDQDMPWTQPERSPVVEPPPPSLPFPEPSTRPPRPRQPRPGAWIGEVLHDLGWN